MSEILVVDDDPDLREFLVEMLRDRGFEVREARDGQEGLLRLEERLPDLVIMDVEMPILDGPGLALEMFIRDAGLERIPVVLCSGSVDFNRIVAKVGTPYFVAKPYLPSALLRVIGQALSERIPPLPIPG